MKRMSKVRRWFGRFDELKEDISSLIRVMNEHLHDCELAADDKDDPKVYELICDTCLTLAYGLDKAKLAELASEHVKALPGHGCIVGLIAQG